MMYPSIAMIITNSTITGNNSVMVSVMLLSADALEIAPRDKPTAVAVLLNMFNSTSLQHSRHRSIVLLQLPIRRL